MNPEEIRDQIEWQFSDIMQDGTKTHVSGVEEDAYGHLAGTRVEEWVKRRLVEKGWSVYYPNEFLLELFRRIGKQKSLIESKISENWWGPLLLTRRQITDFLSDRRVGRWQQEGADLVLFYGSDILRDSEDVILLNVKSHNISRESRPPNIMSAQRLLEFLHETIVKKGYKDRLGKLELWFIGVGYSVKNSAAEIEDVHVKDLFKLDASRIPQINFDAAIQIQWHVKDMIEKQQSKVDFIRSLSTTFLAQWRRHTQGKELKYGRLVADINRILSK